MQIRERARAEYHALTQRAPATDQQRFELGQAQIALALNKVRQ